MSNDMLKRLDSVVAGIHDKFNLSSQKQTKRILKAMENPYFNILAHPTGRLINQREPYSVDMDLVFKEAKQRGCFLEINSQPQRLDLNDIYAKFAKDIGIRFSISTDSHNSASLEYMKYGIYQARRGWVEKKDVINTLSLSKLKQILN
jgi:DNA polymerase (family 10)